MKIWSRLLLGATLLATPACGEGDEDVADAPIRQQTLTDQDVPFASEPPSQSDEAERRADFGSTSVPGATCEGSCVGACQEICLVACDVCPRAAACIRGQDEDSCEESAFGCALRHCPELVAVEVEASSDD